MRQNINFGKLLHGGDYNPEQWLSVLYSLSVFYINFCNLTIKVTFNLVHQFHCFHDGKRLTFFDLISNRNKRICVLGRCCIKSSHKRRFYKHTLWFTICNIFLHLCF